jgi:SPP1 family predicted phage head-tail adaptor
MDAGKMNHSILIQRAKVAYDSYNQPTQTWNTLVRVWAEMVTTGGGEFYAAQKIFAQTTAIFKTRYTTRIKVTDRVTWAGRTFDILALNDKDGTHEELQIVAKESV